MLKFFAIEGHSLVFLRQYQNTHVGTTKEQIDWALNMLSNKIGINFNMLIDGKINPVSYKHRYLPNKIITMAFDDNNQNKGAGLEMAGSVGNKWLLNESSEEITNRIGAIVYDEAVEEGQALEIEEIQSR